MSPYDQKLKTYLVENQLKFDSQGSDALVNDLYWHFAERNPPVSERLQSLHKQLALYFAKLTMQESDELFGVFCHLSLELERLAFLGGLRVATQLMLDLRE